MTKKFSMLEQVGGVVKTKPVVGKKFSFLKKVVPEVSIKSLINGNVGGFSKPRSKVHIHASDLTKEIEYCPREVRLMELLKKKYKDEWIPTELQITFDDGNDKQSRINNIYLDKYMLGPWRCASCGQTNKWHEGKPEEFCCKIPNWLYEEPHLVDEYSGTQGAVDGIIKFPGLTLARMMENKIMAVEMFKKLKAPLAEHKLRTQLYLYLLDVSGVGEKRQIDTKIGHVFYCMRGHGAKDDTGSISPFKEYTVERNDDNIKPLIKKARQLTVSRISANMIPPPVCINAMCSRAGKCKVSKECFSGYAENDAYLQLMSQKAKLK